MPKIRRHHRRSSRRVAPPKDSDFDHEITLVNKEDVSPTSSRESLAHTNTNGDAAEPSGSRRRQKRLSVSTDSRSGVEDGEDTPHRVGTSEGTAIADDDVKATAPPDGPSVIVQRKSNIQLYPSSPTSVSYSQVTVGPMTILTFPNSTHSRP